MTKSNPLWLSIAFLASFLAVGVPYWIIPYNKLNLPDALLGAGLIVVAAASAVLSFHGIASFWSVVKVLTASLPAVVIVRVGIDWVGDPTSHNLWPFELIIVAVVGFLCAIGGAGLGSLLTKLRPGE